MKNLESKKQSYIKPDLIQSGYPLFALATILSLVGTFYVSNTQFTAQTKTIILVFVIFLNILIWLRSYLKEQQILTASIEAADETATGLYNSEIEEKLLALEEASEYFGASLKPEDMFRLVVSRVNEIIPFDCVVLFLAADNGASLTISAAAGENADSLVGLKLNSSKGLAGKTFVSRKPQGDDKLLYDKNVLPARALAKLNAAIAVPLSGETDVFGVLELYAGREKRFDENSLELLEAVAVRVAPLFLSSMAFEQSLSNALTDVLTGLPNERAFFLVLENQIAEAERFRDDRSLTVLTVDIKDFAELNQKIGHAAGDRVLSFAADHIKGQLRQMDFLARAAGDEFMIILPTASREVTREIAGRIEKAFRQNHFAASEQENFGLELNFGAATFWQEGETPQKLLHNARLRRQQAKSEQTNKVAWFPSEFVN